MDPKEYTIVRERESGQISSQNSKWINYLDIRIRFYLYLKNNKYQINKAHYKAISNAILLCAKHHKKYALKHLINNLSLLFHMNFKTQLSLIYNLSINKN